MSVSAVAARVVFFCAAASTLFAAMPAEAQPLGVEFRVNTYTSYFKGFPAVTADSTGNFVIAWQSFSEDGSFYGIFARRYSKSGQALTDDFQVNATSTRGQYYPSVASDPSGNFVVVWMSLNEVGDGVIFGQRYGSSGAPRGGEFQISTYSSGNAAYPSVAVDGAGSFVVVWNTNGYRDGAVVDGRRYDGAGAPLGGEFRISTFTIETPTRPSVASDPLGNFVVAWDSHYDTDDIFPPSVAARRFSNTGAALGGEFRVNTYTTGYQRRSRVASDAKGNFVVVWESQLEDGSGFGVFGQRYGAAGVPVGPEFRVNTYTSNDQGSPVVARGAAGDFVVGWQSDGQDGNQYEIFLRRFNADGVGLGAEFHVDTYTTGKQYHSAVAFGGDGNVVVVWSNQSQEILGQRTACGVAGDVNGNGVADVADVFYLINYLFASGPAPVCSGDVNGVGSVDVADVFYLINYLFAGGSAPL